MDHPTPKDGTTQEKSSRAPGSLGGKYRVKSAGFSIHCQAVMLTYPFQDLTKAEVLERIVSRVHDLNGAVVGEEMSDTGYHHFHVYAECTSKRLWTMKELDYFGGLHGHYQPVRENYMTALAYCIKDGNFVKGGTQRFDSAVKEAIRLNCRDQPLIIDFFLKEHAISSTIRKPSSMPDLKTFVGTPEKKDDK